MCVLSVVPRFYLIAFLFLFNSCTRLFFVPLRPLLPKEQVEESLGVAIKENILRNVHEPNLHGASVSALRRDKKEALVLFLHGNAGNVSTQIYGVSWLLRYDVELLLFDYRGYGNSHGKVEIEGIHRDVCRMIRFASAEKRKKNLPLFVIGESLGATLLITTLATFSNCGTPNGVVVVSPFLSYPGVARDTLYPLGVFRFFFYPFSWLVRADYDPVRAINSYPNVPTLILHGMKDKIVPYYHGQKFFDLLPRLNVTGYKLPDLGHNEVLSDQSVRNIIIEFMKLPSKN